MYLSQQVTRGPQRKASAVHHHVQRVGEPGTYVTLELREVLWVRASL